MNNTTPPHVLARRALELKEIEDAIRLRLQEPWVNQLHDLVLARQLFALGIKQADIPGLIGKELARMFPSTWSDEPAKK